MTRTYSTWLFALTFISCSTALANSHDRLTATVDIQSAGSNANAESLSLEDANASEHDIASDTQEVGEADDITERTNHPCENAASAWSEAMERGSAAEILGFLDSFAHCAYFVNIATQELQRLGIAAEELAAENAAKVTDVDLLRQEVVELELQIQSLEADVAMLDEQRQALTRRLGEAQVDADTAREAAAQLQDRINSERNTALDLRRAVREALADLAQALEDVDALNATVVARQRIIDALSNEKTHLVAQAEALTSELESRQTELQAARAEATRQRNAAETAQRERDLARLNAYEANNEVEQLRGELDASEHKVVGLTDQIEDLDRSVAQMQGVIVRLNVTISELEEQNLVSGAQIEGLLQQIRALEEEIRLLEVKLTEQDALIGDLEATISMRNARIAELADYTTELYQSLQTAKGDVQRISERFTELEVENVSLNSQIRSLENNGKTLGAEFQRTMGEVERLTELSDGLRALVNELRSELSGVQLTNEDLTQKVTELEAELEQAGAEVAKLQSDLAQTRVENEELAVSNEALAATVVELKTNIDDKNEEVDRLRSENAELEEVNHRLTDRSEKTEAEFIRLNTAHEQLVVAHEAVLKQLSDTQDAVEALDTARRHLLSFLTEIFGTDDCITQNDGRLSFCSTVMFEIGSDVLSAEGRRAIGAVASQMAEIDAIIERQTSSLSCPDGIAEAGCIEAKIDWILRIDGHTDNLRIHPHNSRFQDNWDLSTARAQAVVRYMIEEHGVSPTRLAATGFGEFHPIADNDTEEGRARNRRIDITLSHR